MNQQETTAVINLATALLPEIIALFRSKNPGLATMTDAQVTQAIAAAASQTIAVDEEWKRTHPPTS